LREKMEKIFIELLPRKTIRIGFAVTILLLLQATAIARKNNPDSVYLFSYATLQNNSHNGLHFAWSRDGDHWISIGNEYGFLKSDYGRWGSEKKMFSPFLFLGNDGLWHCVWSLNEKDKVFAHAASTDLIEWGRQSYPALNAGANCLNPIIAYNTKDNSYTITYQDKNQHCFQTTTKDFKTYTVSKEISTFQYQNPT